MQFPLSQIPDEAYTAVNTTENIVGIPSLSTLDMGTVLAAKESPQVGSHLQTLPNMRAYFLAVSLRKTAVVLFHNRRRVRIMMVEEEEDDEEEDEMDESGFGVRSDANDSSFMQRSAVTNASVTMQDDEEMQDENKENADISVRTDNYNADLSIRTNDT